MKVEFKVLIASISIILVAVLVFILFGTSEAVNFASYLSGVSTVGIFILTSFYVIYTNKQIQEIQKQRQLQIQPLPNLTITRSVILSPRIVIDYGTNGEIALVVDCIIEGNIKNIGNGAAVLVDVFPYFHGKDISSVEDVLYSTRYLTFEQNKERKYYDRLRDENYEVLYSLNKSSEGACPVKSAFDVLIKFNVLYKNILGAAFLSSIDCIVAIDKENQKILSGWIACLNSFKTDYSGEIEKYKAVYQRNKGEAITVFHEIQDKFYSKMPPQLIEIDVMPVMQSFVIQPLDHKKTNEITQKIRHATPIGIERLKEDPDYEAWKEKVIKRNF